MQIHSLTVLYDAECGVCSQTKNWLMAQPTYIELRFIPLQDPQLNQWFPGVEVFRPNQEIVVISDHGAVYCGAQAWVMCLWALRLYRPWSLRFAQPNLFPWVQKFCRMVAKNRLEVSSFLRIKSDAKLVQKLRNEHSVCVGNACKT